MHRLRKALLLILANWMCVGSAACGGGGTPQDGGLEGGDVLVPDAGRDAGPREIKTWILTTEDARAPLEAFSEFLPESLAAGVMAVQDPIRSLREFTRGERRFAVVAESGRCAECFRIEEGDGGWIVKGGLPLGVQYGVSALLEAMGVRFFHPHYTYVPPTLQPPDRSIINVDHQPEIDMRGLQFHILHPIETYFDFWEPSPEHLQDAYRTLQWVVANRGNFVTWPGIRNLRTASGEQREALVAHQRAIIERAHLHGLRVGFGVQIFGLSNLQNAYDLVTSSRDNLAEAITQNMEPLRQLPFDAINFSFGEFFAANPEQFIQGLELAHDAARAIFPRALISGTIHVGDFPTTRIDYMGNRILYYFLIDYARRPIRPWVHTVMYYGLFGSAGGAYNHANFNEHREYLFRRLAEGKEVGYKPESAYWVAFDINVPTYLPLYIYKRWEDLHGIRERARMAMHGGLEDHVLFTSGWEWGYWQIDWAVLRMNWKTPSGFDEVVAEMLAPLPDAREATDIIRSLALLQNEYLIEKNLAAYLAGQDATFEIGYAMGFWSQPRRPSMRDIQMMSEMERNAFERDVVNELRNLANATRNLLERVERLPSLGRERVWAELRDGIAIDLARAEFASALWGAALQASRGADPSSLEAAMERALDSARNIVRRRHAALFDPRPEEILAHRISTALIYRYGYLREADTLCFWVRERAQYLNTFRGASERVPGCVL
ncbi:MAG: hypothetical protein RMJ84_00625 [Sandaracinaceae bacterium]|nr:hypothetical protein [Sandaracinaceae bacterium]